VCVSIKAVRAKAGVTQDCSPAAYQIFYHLNPTRRHPVARFLPFQAKIVSTGSIEILRNR
jgi:hypothetical protein